MDDVLSELAVEMFSAWLVTQVAHKVLEVQAGASGGVSATFAVLADDGGGDAVLVPWLEAWVLHKLVLEGRYEALEWVSDNEELKV